MCRHGLASTVTSASYLGWRSKRLVTQENMAKVLGLPASDPRVKRAALQFLEQLRPHRGVADLPALRGHARRRRHARRT